MAHKKTRTNPKGAGRPKGSKNKTHSAISTVKRGRGRPRKLSSVIARIKSLDESEFRRLRGRPKGSKNKATFHGTNHHGEKITITGTLIHHK